MPRITFNLQLNTYLSADELQSDSLKTKALKGMPLQGFISNYRLKHFIFPTQAQRM